MNNMLCHYLSGQKPNNGDGKVQAGANEASLSATARCVDLAPPMQVHCASQVKGSQ